MSYLPDNPTRERQPELYQPILFPRSGGARAPARAGAWSNHAFWGTVVCLGCAGALLLAWGAYVGAPRGGNTEKLLQAQQAVPKLKGEATAAQPLTAVPIQAASADPPPVPVAPLQPPAPMPVEFPALPMVELPMFPLPPAKIEPPPVPEPLKIETPVAASLHTLPALPVKIDSPVLFPAPMPIEPPVVPPPLPVEVVQPILDQHQESPIFLGRANPGETPMIRTWKTLALYSLLAVAPVVAPAPAIAGGQDDAAKLQKQFEDLRKLLDTAVKSINDAGKGIDTLKTDIGKLQDDVNVLKTSKLAADVDLGKANTKIENLEKQLSNVQADVNFLKRELSKQVTSSNGSTLDKALLEEMKKHLVSIEQAILKLRSAEPTTPRIALSPPALTGRVILANMYHEEMLFVINQKTYRVAPGTVLPLEAVTAGTVEYEVLSPTWGQRARSRTNLPANETFTLTAR